MVNPIDQTIEQFILAANANFDLADVYRKDEIIRSTRLTCVQFSVKDVMITVNGQEN